MTQRSYPFVNGATTDAEFSAMFRTPFPSSVLAGLQVTGDSSGLNVKVSAGSGYVRGHYYTSDAQVTLAVDAGSANHRVDMVVLRLEYGSVNDIHLAIVKGTPSASPVAPTLTQTTSGIYEFPLASIAVLASAVTITAANVTDRRVFWADVFGDMVNVDPVTWPTLADKPTSFPNDDVTNASGSSSAAGGTLVRRDGSGKFGVPTPTAGTNPANKDYVDNVGTTSDTPNTVMRRNGNGQTAVATPTTSGMAANKGYVDQLDVDQWVIIDETRAGYFHSNPWSRDITGTRRAVWMSQPDGDGFISIGYTSSSRFKKQDIRPAELSLEQLRGIPVVLYRYRKAVAAERAGKVDHAATELGTIAEDLHDLDLWQFVIYEDGKPAGVHYELLSLAALSLGQQLADRVDDLDARLKTLENR